MDASPASLREIGRQVARLATRRKAGSARVWATWFTQTHGLAIERLVLPGEEVAARQRLDAWYAYHEPASPGQTAQVEQAVVAKLNIERCHRFRAALQAEKVRTAELHWQRAIEDDIYHWHALFNTNNSKAMNGLERSAAGMRQLIKMWDGLEKRLTEDGTWFGADRLRAINLQGFSSLPLDLYFEEGAYWTYVHSMAASPNPTQLDIDTIHSNDIMPKRLQDLGVPVWRPDPEVSRQFLRDLVTRELARLRREEEELRIKQEEPSKAAAVDLALARLTKDEVVLMRELRGHERSLQQATGALEKARKQDEGRKSDPHKIRNYVFLLKH